MSCTVNKEQAVGRVYSAAKKTKKTTFDSMWSDVARSG